jgi:hypothetical protein
MHYFSALSNSALFTSNLLSLVAEFAFSSFHFYLVLRSLKAILIVGVSSQFALSCFNTHCTQHSLLLYLLSCFSLVCTFFRICFWFYVASSLFSSRVSSVRFSALFAFTFILLLTASLFSTFYWKLFSWIILTVASYFSLVNLCFVISLNWFVRPASFFFRILCCLKPCFYCHLRLCAFSSLMLQMLLFLIFFS